MQPSPPHEVDVSAQMEARLEQLRQAYSLPTTTMVLELLISAQLDRTVYDITGLRPGPKLVIDNTTNTTHQG